MKSKPSRGPGRPAQTFAALSMGLAALLGGHTAAMAHGGPVERVALEKTLSDFGATVTWDDYTQTYTIIKDGAYVQIKPGAKSGVVNGKRFDVLVPIELRHGVAYVGKNFINEAFQSGLDQTFQVEKTPHPLNPLSAEEIKRAKQIATTSPHYRPGIRYTRIALHAPPKDQVWAWDLQGTPLTAHRQADVTMLDGKQVIAALVDLTTGTLVSCQPLADTQGMVLLDDFSTVQTAIEQSSEYASALRKRGINDVKKVVATPLTVGYFDGKDGLKENKRLLKVVSYQDIGDDNYWAHPIENLVAIVDLETKKVIKIEDAGVIPVPLVPNPYNQPTAKGQTPKPLDIVEPLGKNYTITGNSIHWQNWDFHVRMDSRVGPILSTVTYNDQGRKRQILYEGSLGGMIVPYGDPDVGWYFKAYLDSGDYGMGTLTSPIARGKDAPNNAVLLDATIADYTGEPIRIPQALAVFERYAGPEYKHQELGQPNVSTERRELVVRWISTVGNYDYIFDWVFQPNGTIGINTGATGLEAVKGVKTKTMHDATAKEDTRYGTLIDHNIVGTTHQHLYNFRLDLDVDGTGNSLTDIDPVVLPNDRGGPRTSTMQTKVSIVQTEQAAAQKFDPSTVRLLVNPSRENRMGYPVGYQLIPFAGGTHPVAKGANFGPDEWLYNRLGFMDKQLWVTRYDPQQLYPEGEYPNRSTHETGLVHFAKDNQDIVNQDNVVWLTTGTTHMARAEEWPIMPTEWVNVLLKPWNFFDRTPTLPPAKP